ncbi:hypothetical protein AB0I37_24810 [Micromonospora purpureochromogenes]|uniref:hypothetical protein n=1 Tax=Micromonospora purpureochromogenes TaxID=47872 RepID=UPI0033D78459
MGLFSSKGSNRDNSGTAGGGFTVTGRHQAQMKTARKEWTSPRKGSANFGSKTRRPGQ